MDETEFIDPISLDTIPSDRVVEVKERAIIWHMDMRFLLENILIHDNRLNPLTKNPLSDEVLKHVDEYRQKHLRVVIITDAERDMLDGDVIQSVVIDDVYLVGDLHVRCVLELRGDITRTKVMLDGISLTERSLGLPIAEFTNNEIIRVTVGRSSIRGEHYTSLKEFVTKYDRYGTMFSPFPLEDIPNGSAIDATKKRGDAPRLTAAQIFRRRARAREALEQNRIIPSFQSIIQSQPQPSVPSFQPPSRPSFGQPPVPSFNQSPAQSPVPSFQPPSRPSFGQSPVPSFSQPPSRPSFSQPPVPSFTEFFGQYEPPTGSSSQNHSSFLGLDGRPSFVASSSPAQPSIRPSERLAEVYSLGIQEHLTALNTPSIPSFVPMMWKIIHGGAYPKYDIEPLTDNPPICPMNGAIRAAISSYNFRSAHPVRHALLNILTGRAKQTVINNMVLPTPDVCPDEVPDASPLTRGMAWYPSSDTPGRWTWDIFNINGLQPHQPMLFITGTTMTHNEVESIRSYNGLANLSPIFVPHGRVQGVSLGKNARKVISEWRPLPDPSLTVTYMGNPDRP